MAELTAADLSVVIPTRDRWDILAQTLNSLSTQSVSGFETIVVVDGTDQQLPELDSTTVLVKRRAGPAAARNAGARATQRPLVMFLGDDTIPVPDLVERHIASHQCHPEREAAVVGFLDWHDSVARNRINSWLDWSGTQFWFRSLARQGEQEVSHWHLYTSNVSLKRDFLFECGGFDEDFPFAAFEDIECGLRLSELGLRLYYEPSAICHHLHDYDWPGLERRFAAMALSERLMVEKHPEIAPGCLNRMKEANSRTALPVERLVDSVPTRLGRLDQIVRSQANRRYHRRLSPTYIAAWDRADELCELRRYLGDRYDSARLVYGSPPGSGTAHPSPQEPGERRLFDLARQGLVGDARRARSLLRKYLPSGSNVLDYGCGIGSDGLSLAALDYSVRFADHPGLPLDYLRWRLAERALRSPVYELGVDTLPRGLDAAYCLDAAGPGRDPVEILQQLQEVAPIVVLGLANGNRHQTSAEEALIARLNSSGLIAQHPLTDGSRLLVFRR